MYMYEHIKKLMMPESYLPHAMSAHEAAFVYVCVDTVYSSLCGILPHVVVAVVGKFRYA